MGLRDLFVRDRRPPAEKRFGTGLWRQHRDRFSRSVDRFYETARALHEEFGALGTASGAAASGGTRASGPVSSGPGASGPGAASVPPASPGAPDIAESVEQISRLTLELNELDERVAELLETCQREVPLSDLVFPAWGRAALGDAPEAVSRASALVAQAAQAAAMLRAHLRMGIAGRLDEYPRAAHGYVGRAAELIRAVSGG